MTVKRGGGKSISREAIHSCNNCRSERVMKGKVLFGSERVTWESGVGEKGKGSLENDALVRGEKYSEAESA